MAKIPKEIKRKIFRSTADVTTPPEERKRFEIWLPISTYNSLARIAYKKNVSPKKLIEEQVQNFVNRNKDK